MGHERDEGDRTNRAGPPVILSLLGTSTAVLFSETVKNILSHHVYVCFEAIHSTAKAFHLRIDDGAVFLHKLLQL